MKHRWALQAYNLHQGGGRTVLMALLSALPGDFKGHAFLDTRLEGAPLLPGGLTAHRVRPTLRHRFRAEWSLRQISDECDRVLCLGNLPPLFKLRSRVIVFLQNRFLVEQASLRGFPGRIRARIAVERRWLANFSAHTDCFIVQTPSMKRALEARLARPVAIHVMPFVAADPQLVRRRLQDHTTATEPVREFLYVASGEEYKNHRSLIRAWSLLAEEGEFPTLYLTLSSEASPDLCRWIDDMKQAHSLRIENLGPLPHETVQKLFKPGRALIHASVLESLPLPVVEARQAGLPVLAPELDYVRDVIDPEQSFLPTSPTSIAQAVKRFMGIAEPPLPLMDGRTFLAKLEQLEL